MYPWADPAAGPLLTLLQYVVVAVVLLPSILTTSTPPHDHDTHHLKPPTLRQLLPWPFSQTLRLAPTLVPRLHYVGMAGLFALMSLLNNMAFAFNITQPLHMVFRSANAMVSLLLGFSLFKRRYSLQACLAVFVLTAGALCNVVAEASIGDTAVKAAALGRGEGGCTGPGCGQALRLSTEPPGGPSSLSGAAASISYMLTWWMGISMLCTVLCMQVLLAEYQSWAGRTFGKSSLEAAFYLHAYSLPFLVLFVCLKKATDAHIGPIPLPTLQVGHVFAQMARWSASPSLADYYASLDTASGPSRGSSMSLALSMWTGRLACIVGLGRLPTMWYFVVLNVGTQYICIRGVYDIIAQTDPLTVNVVLTLRKAVSVVLSITLFGHAFSSWHWIGAFLVFAAGFYFGTLPAPAPVGGSGGPQPVPSPSRPGREEADPGGDVQQAATTPLAVVVAHDGPVWEDADTFRSTRTRARRW
jgi:solute carrier family 35 (UDP-xylose/UDP-N-acetylglucosamine transporter), member B4